MPRIPRRYSSATPLLVLSLLIGLISLPDVTNALLNLIHPTVSAATNFPQLARAVPAEQLAQRYLEITAPATTFTVTNTNDSGAGSLRQAITDANNSPGLDTISFNIGSGLQTITPLQRLPPITDPVLIDGTTQPGFSGPPLIELNGAVQPDGNGLFIAAGNSTVRSLVLNGFHFNGISMTGNGGNRVEGCYIGTDITGTVAKSNGSSGISISVSNNIIGGTTAGKRNVISGNVNAGIDISRGCCDGDASPMNGNIIQGNYIGVDAAGNKGIGNTGYGIRMSSLNSDVDVTGNIVGGTVAGAGNVISGNKRSGILIEGFKARNNSIQGNYIGTDALGGFAIRNEGKGVQISTGYNNLIGGATPGAGNVISGNGGGSSGSGDGIGVSIENSASGNIVQGNLIGTNAAMTRPIGNLLFGVLVDGGNSIIGGVGPGEANVIAFNYFGGIICANPAINANSFRANSIFSNGSDSWLGIDLGPNGPTPNDTGDADSGANGLQNFPVLTVVNVAAGSVNVQGTFNSVANTTFGLDFYSNSTCHALGFGQGARFIGSAMVTTDAQGNGTFDLMFTVSLPPNQVITSTATDPAGNTSEFSHCFPSSPATGSVGLTTSGVFVAEGFDSQASFVVQRTGGSAGSLSVNYVVIGESATVGSDFEATEGTLTFADGETSKSINVPIINDNIDESYGQYEVAYLSLTPAGSLDTVGTANVATIYIEDDDTRGIVINDQSVYEGSGNTNATFTVSLSAASTQTITVDYATQANTATANNDYQSTNGTLTFNPGETSKTINVVVIGDTLVEPDEKFFINLSNSTNANIRDSRGVGTILNDDGLNGVISFSQSSYSVSESAGLTTITVNRSGNATQAVSVRYFSAEGSLTFSPCSVINGIADSRCDFTSALGTLQFAAGETAKTFVVLISQDSYVEGPETITLGLSDPTNGAALGTPYDATLTILDDAAEPAGNPIDSADAFVRQHYHDFLNREPDAAGLAFWTNQITECEQPGATCSAEVRRINVSAAFFLSIEFQQTGYLVYRIYKSAYGNITGTPVPLRFVSEFLPDTQQIGKDVVIGQPGAEQQLEANKVAYALDFVSRSRFTDAYPTTLAPTEFVDALFANAGVAPSATDRNAAINEFGGAGNTADTGARARALRRVAENSTLTQQETNRAFVLMQYFGYLRRNPNDPPEANLDFSGYNFWLGKLNEFNGNFVNAEMVKAFIVSAEYRQRFGP